MALDIAFFASSLVAAWNRTATDYRGIVRALRRRGGRISFDEPDAFDRQKHRAIADPPRARMVVSGCGGFPPVVRSYLSLGARARVPHLSFLGNSLPDRDARVDEFLLAAAEAGPELRFLLGRDGRPLPPNVRSVGHVDAALHDAFSCSARAVLHASRENMARHGHSPAPRVFEAAGTGFCLIADAWDGIEEFFESGEEVLVALTGVEVAEYLRRLGEADARAIGERARRRVLAGHTCAHRAERIDETLGLTGPRARPAGRQPEPLRIVFLGLSITSSWGNGHATTYRGLMRELCRRGHDVLFLERDRPWYAENRDLPVPPYGRTELYHGLDELRDRHAGDVGEADLVVVGSFVADGSAVGRWVVDIASGLTAFYDIDAPVTLARLESGVHDYIAPDLVGRYHLYLSFTGGPTLDRIERELGSPRALPLYCSVDPDAYLPIGGDPTRDLGYLGTYSEDRKAALDRLLFVPARAWPEGRFEVAGTMYPVDLPWPANVSRRDRLPPAQHAAFCGGNRFTLHLTRAHMREAGFTPSLRLLEAAACATAIITDPWPGLETFFRPDRELIVAHSAADVLRYLRDLGDDERRALGRTAREAVLARHTARQRAIELEGYVALAREALARRRERVGLAGGRP